MKAPSVLLSWLPYLFLLLAVYLLHKQLSTIELSTLLGELRRWNRYDLTEALLLTAASFLVLTLYDFLSVRQLQKKLPLKQIFLTAFAAFSISNIVGHSLVSGSSIRLKSYGRSGLSFAAVATLALFNSLTFSVGFCFLLALATLLGSNHPALRELWISPSALGFSMALLTILYLGAAWRWGGESLKFKQLQLSWPSLPVAGQQIVLGSLDLCLCAAVIYVLLPDSMSLSFWPFLTYCLIAQMLGVLSQVPGGLGVLDGLLLRFLSPYAAVHELVMSIILFRIVYYTLPLSITLLAKFATSLKTAAGLSSYQSSKASDSSAILRSKS